MGARAGVKRFVRQSKNGEVAIFAHLCLNSLTIGEANKENLDMTATKYQDRIITDARVENPAMLKQLEELRGKGKSSIQFTHLLSVDGDRIKDFFCVDASWLWRGSAQDPVDGPHVHDFAEVMAFVGANREDPHDLGGEVTIWLDDYPQTLKKSCLIFVPAGIKHGPVLFSRVDKPLFCATIAQTSQYTSRSADPVQEKSAAPEVPSYTIITETKAKFSVAAGEGGAPPIPRDPSLVSSRILHLEDDMAKGSFYVDFVWIYEGNGGAPAPEHNHDWVELIAMVGADPEHPRDLGGAMSIVLGDENHVLTQSNLVCIPAGLKHCPWKFIGIKKPTLVFTAGPSGMYTGSHKKQF